MSKHLDVYISSVCLERTRWGKRQASFPVSEWLQRFKADGFDGVELWEYHFQLAAPDEQARLIASRDAIAIYNSYMGFGDEEAEARTAAAEAVGALGVSGVKYNLGGDRDRLDEYRRNLLAWADALPVSCRLLCECHPGSVLEKLEDAVAFFAELDPSRFGVIAHLSGGAGGTQPWLAAFGERVKHLHLQLRGPETDPSVEANRAALDLCFASIPSHASIDSLSIEFTRGIGRDEDIEMIYMNARKDLAYCREVLGC